jgi:hypothetical protein
MSGVGETDQGGSPGPAPTQTGEVHEGELGREPEPQKRHGDALRTGMGSRHGEPPEERIRDGAVSPPSSPHERAEGA